MEWFDFKPTTKSCSTLKRNQAGAIVSADLILTLRTSCTAVSFDLKRSQKLECRWATQTGVWVVQPATESRTAALDQTSFRALLARIRPHTVPVSLGSKDRMTQHENTGRPSVFNMVWSIQTDCLVGRPTSFLFKSPTQILHADLSVAGCWLGLKIRPCKVVIVHSQVVGGTGHIPRP